MMPSLGSGAGQALEVCTFPVLRNKSDQLIQDSYTLSTLLTHSLTTRETVAQALKAYSQARHPRAQRFVESSRENGMRLSFNMEEGTSLVELAALINKTIAITREGDPLKDAQEAVELLKAFVA
jgi:2-polyprenyl-6-methoxyphenol hydroxylase-like FAD-dependent oxidoreductase